MSIEQIIEADLTWTGAAFEPGVRVTVDADGRISEVGSAERPTRRLEGAALLPGFVNAHSHAFQRALRGRGESFPKSAGSFWTWREAMYELVSELDDHSFYDLSRAAFEEMLAAGITSVGEFHYLRHSRDSLDFAMDEIILRAASDAGVRIVLLPVYYNTGDIGKPLDGAQKRFSVDSVEDHWRRHDDLAATLDSPTQSLGAVVHSIRAASINECAELHAEAMRRDLVFHMHVEEQQREIDTCREAYGATPMRLLTDRLELDRRTTAIHCTHTDPEDMARFGAAGANVCICPLTEANLADGVADLHSMRSAGAALCIGTDSNVRLSFQEELRWLEYVQRLVTEQRGVVIDDQGSVARELLTIATSGGARSLGLNAGVIRVGALADFIALDLNHPSLRGVSPETLLDGFLLGAAESVIEEVCVGGRWIRPVH